MKINYIPQEEKYGCAIACMAMVTGLTYKEVKSEWHEKYGVREGIDEFMRTSFLFKHGFVSHTEYKCETYTQKIRTREEWIRPFAPIHIISTITSNGPHAIIWIQNGNIYDPDIPGIHNIDEYQEINSITGYWPLSSFK